MYDGKSFSFQDTYIESDAYVKIQREEFVREYAHYVVFKNAQQSQCLIYRQADGEMLHPIEYWDLDGDGLQDLMFNINDFLFATNYIISLPHCIPLQKNL